MVLKEGVSVRRQAHTVPPAQAHTAEAAGRGGSAQILYLYLSAEPWNGSLNPNFIYREEAVCLKVGYG